MKRRTYDTRSLDGWPARITGPDLSESDSLTLLGFTLDRIAVVRYAQGEFSNFTLEYGLTSCCFASVTGTEWGIACRECYQDADPALDLLSAKDVVYTVQED